MILRPNIAMDAPPTSIEVGGFVHNINTDYRVWIRVLDALREMLPEMETDEDIAHNAIIITSIATELMGTPPEWKDAEEIGEFIGAVVKFAQGYPAPPVEPGNDSAAQTYSLGQDIGNIVHAFQHYYNEDIGYGCASYHWWIFMDRFRALCGDLMITRLMEIRGYTGKDEELRKLARRYALPREETAAERRMMEEIRNEFYGAQ